MQIWISSNWENFATDVITSEKKKPVLFGWSDNFSLRG